MAYPVVKLWVDKATGNVLKRQEFALSGRLMRTLYYPKWQKLFSESKGADVWYPAGDPHLRRGGEGQLHHRDAARRVDLRPLEANIFTKAWLESKSR